MQRYSIELKAETAKKIVSNDANLNVAAQHLKITMPTLSHCQKKLSLSAQNRTTLKWSLLLYRSSI